MPDDKAPEARNQPHIVWVSDEMAKNLGLETEEQKQAFYEAEERTAAAERERWFQAKLVCAAGKPTAPIPRNGTCRHWRHFPEHDEEPEEMTEAEAWRRLLEGTLKMNRVQSWPCCYLRDLTQEACVCEFLESYSLNGGDEHLAALVEYYGSEEALEQADDLWIWLLDGMPQCGRVVAAMEAEEREKESQAGDGK